MRNKQLMAVAVLAVSILAATGCGAIGSEPTSAPHNNPTQDGTVVTDHNTAASSNSGTGKTVQRTLYFVDQKNRVIPMRADLPVSNTPAKQALDYMTTGGPAAWLDGTGLHAPIPASTKVLSIAVSGDVAKVDLGQAALAMKDSNQQRAMIDAITWELTEFPTIKHVQFMFNGHVVPALQASGIPVGGNLNRESGINLEVAENVNNPADTSKVTVYLDETTAGAHYLVPVTRVVPQSADQDIVKETIAALHEGALHSGLNSPLASNAKLINDSINGKTATLDFDQAIYNKGQVEEAVHALSLSLAATAGIEQLKITVNGKTPQTTQGVDFSKVVVEPTYINQTL